MGKVTSPPMGNKGPAIMRKSPAKGNNKSGGKGPGGPGGKAPAMGNNKVGGKGPAGPGGKKRKRTPTGGHMFPDLE